MTLQLDTAVPELDDLQLSDAVSVLDEEVPVADAPEILQEVVIEEVSIDGMCGVY